MIKAFKCYFEMASNLLAMASNLIAMASNLLAMASTLLAKVCSSVLLQFVVQAEHAPIIPLLKSHLCGSLPAEFKGPFLHLSSYNAV